MNYYYILVSQTNGLYKTVGPYKTELQAKEILREYENLPERRCKILKSSCPTAADSTWKKLDLRSVTSRRYIRDNQRAVV